MKTFQSYCRKLSAFLATLVFLAPLATQAQDTTNYPNRPIKIIVPVAPGGTVDMVARSIAEALTKALGQQVIVENKPGASS
jgi:tripartite-type tricarboxylate transporter receptor subunit TctC